MLLVYTESEQPGEIALMELKHSRGEQQRLKEIDYRLKCLEMSGDENENVRYFSIKCVPSIL